MIEKNSDKDKLVIDFAKVNLLDHSFREHIEELKNDWEENGKSLDLINQDHLISVSDHPLSAKISMNHEHLGITKLDERQHELQNLANEMNLDYFPVKSLSFNQYQGYSFNLQGKVKYTSNMISGTLEGHWIVYNEILVDTDLQTKSANNLIPAVSISLGSTVPKFTLEQEGFFDRIKSYAGFDDIDFDNYPNFSEQFLLKGEDENSIREYFKPELIELIENNPNYHIENNGAMVLIYPFSKKIDLVEIRALLDFARNFIAANNQN